MKTATVVKKQKIYVANCIEDGERFVVYFKTANTDPKFIREFAQGEASGWGGECISITEWRPKRVVKLLDTKTGKTLETTEKKWENWQLKESQLITILKKSTGKKMQTTRTKFNNWITKNKMMFPKVVEEWVIVENAIVEELRYKFAGYVYEQEPKDMWDADKSVDENLKDYKLPIKKFTNPGVELGNK